MSWKALLLLFIFIIIIIIIINIIVVTIIVIVIVTVIVTVITIIIIFNIIMTIISISKMVKVCSPYSLVAAKLGWECMTDSTGLTAMHAISTNPPSAEEEEAPASELLCKEAATCPVAGEDSALLRTGPP